MKNTNVFSSVTSTHTLSGYIQNMLLASGLETIAQIDINETSQTNDVDRILSYVIKIFWMIQGYYMITLTAL